MTARPAGTRSEPGWLGRLETPARVRLWLAVLLLPAVLALPAGTIEGTPAWLIAGPGGAALVALGLAALAGGVWLPARRRRALGLVLTASAVALGLALLLRLRDGLVFAGGAPATGVVLAVVLVVLWQAMAALAGARDRAALVAVPLLFGALLVFLWEVLTVGFAVPKILLPAPSAIAAALSANAYTLGQDFVQTFIRSVVPGFVMGSGAGFLTALAIDRSPFLQRGLLPLGSMVSAMPIVGIAPIMVMWFGFDWQSKAAVVVVMTFFPMLVNTLAGLQAAGAMEHDLMRSYAATYPQTLLKLRLPAALPFIFNALKLNSTLALIGAIVAEFFGTPIVGMGFRISTEVSRLNIDIVWATITVAAAIGTACYGALALVERGTTFWHPSQRK